MSETVERSSLDLRFEGYRLRDEAAEARLLASISERGIEEPLGGVDTPQGRVLLDGFRRNRCAAKLGIECVPYVCWGTDETLGIASLLGARRQRSLSILEQARFVEELLSTHQMTRDRVAGSRILPGHAVAAPGHRRGPLEMDAGPDAGRG